MDVKVRGRRPFVRMPAKESHMSPDHSQRPSVSAKQRAMHREQVNRVRESLRAGVVYARPGRVGKPTGKLRPST